jgi:glutamyl-tRNA(Gln) amidotransferase subunit E
VNELVREYNLNKTQAEKIFDSDYLDVFKRIADTTTVAPSFIASTLTESLVNLERQGLDIAQLNNDKIWFTFERLYRGEIAKESIVPIFEKIMKKEAASVDEAIAKLGLTAIGDEQLNELLDKIVQNNRQAIAEKGTGAMNILMGEAMNTLRGKVDGQKVNTLLKQKIAKLIG